MPFKISPIIKILLFICWITIGEARLFELAKIIPDTFLPNPITYKGTVGTFPANTVGIIKGNGYSVETHQVVTEDGYILEIHRIPSFQKHLPVLLMHGNFQSSADWVTSFPANNSLAFVLSNMGFDVWLGNHRGNTYSKRHVKYKLNSNDYWDFSFHEMGKYDLPALVDYVLSMTGQTKLHYITFSYSTTAFFAGLSTRPEYNSKIATGIAMGPSVFTANFFNGLVYYFSFTSKLVDAFMKIFGAVPILPHFAQSLLNSFLPIICHPKLDFAGVCLSVIQIAFGHDGNLIKREQLPLILSVLPSASGLKAWNHVVQLTGSLQFRQYDYGFRKNLEMYGINSPPNYNLTNVVAPVALFVGNYDQFAHREDARFLATKLPNLIELYFAPYPKFTHLDFTYGRDEAVKVYLHAAHIMQQMEI